ncbi:PadR family transcriptional regulator [Phytohabitans rumicis]|uniref:PadR family transcriptional regulator n=1 Tax=Phytohabitans rumicis TaxID=1076125 RepID=A0A6V8LF31_9ACTN|nr:PadR family transcriptional regulator [Phytohabitans rumicis]GFJ93219.1 PadR family transcriptional regulator [Phytohabitans rumicis]
MKSFLRGAVELHILHHAAEGEIHGAWMSAELARHGYQISPGTLYPTLHRMQQAGLLASRQQVRDGRRIRIYTITEAGMEALDEWRRALRELVAEVLPTPQAPTRPRPRNTRRP